MVHEKTIIESTIPVFINVLVKLAAGRVVAWLCEQGDESIPAREAPRGVIRVCVILLFMLLMFRCY